MNRIFCDACEKPIRKEDFETERSKKDFAICVRVTILNYAADADACCRACVPGAVDKARTLAMAKLEAVERDAGVAQG